MADSIEMAAPANAPAQTHASLSARVRAVRHALKRGTLPLLAIALAAAIMAATAVGSAHIPPQRIIAIVVDQVLRLQIPLLHIQLGQIVGLHVPRIWSETDRSIVLLIRLPRVAGAVLVGAALACSGTLFQALLRNPLADPLLLGTSAGAALGASVAYLIPFGVVWLGFGLVAALAFCGALLAVALVYGMATRRGQTPVVSLLLAGVAVSALLAAGQTLLIVLNPQVTQYIVSLYLWLSGGISVGGWNEVAVVTLLVTVGIATAIYLAPTLDAFALGEEMAGYLGVQVERRKLLVVATATLLVGAAVSISGLVGFVGLLAPHACRIVLGPRHRLLVPAAALAGALFVVVADLLARTVAAPTELPLGVLTALVGGPFFLYLLRQAGLQYRW